MAARSCLIVPRNCSSSSLSSCGATSLFTASVSGFVTGVEVCIISNNYFVFKLRNFLIYNEIAYAIFYQNPLFFKIFRRLSS